MGRDVHGVGSTDHGGQALKPGPWLERAGRRAFFELAVVAVMVTTMSLVVVAVVFVVSVKGSHGVVDDEGRARACANGGGDRSRVVMWAGDEVENQEVAWRGPGTAWWMWAGHAAGGRWAALEGRADETSVYDSSVR